MSETSIEWTDRSINPIRTSLNGRTGHHCVKVSAGCKNCYSSKLQPRFGLPAFDAVVERKGVEHYLDYGRLEQVLRRRTPTKWFWCDMTDLFGGWVKNEWISTCFAVMQATPHHTHQVLTKRPERMISWMNSYQTPDRVRLEGERLAARYGWCHAHEDRPWPLDNVWLGTSAEDQSAANQRIPLLLECPAPVWFVSMEPLLDRVRLAEVPGLNRAGSAGRDILDRLWVIVGGESGPRARPCCIEWIGQVVNDCERADVACFVKQLGSRSWEADPNGPMGLRHPKGGDINEWPESLRVRQWPKSMIKVAA